MSATTAWSASPAAPVAALAQPLVEMIALAQPNFPSPAGSVAARCAFDRRTGAAAKAFGVKTAAAAAGRRSPSGPGAVATSARSGRPEALIPATPPTATNPPGITARRSTGGRSVEKAVRGGVTAVVIGFLRGEGKLLEPGGLGQPVD